MKARTTQTDNGQRLLSHPEGGFKAQPEFSKYIMLRFHRREQVTVFPFSLKHADVFRYMRRECPELEAVSAGFFIVADGVVWTTGNSESLNLTSRPEDAQAVASFLQSPDRQVWDLIRLSEEARESAQREMAEAVPC